MPIQWYLLHTNPRKEAYVACQLEDHSLEMFYPTITIERGHRRGVRDEALFPHYLFVKVDLMSAGAPDLRHMPGVRTVVHFNNQLAIIPEEVIVHLRARISALARRTNLADHLYEPGQALRIRSGPFAGLDAVFQAGIKGTERAQVLLDVLGKLSRVQIDVAALEAA